MRLAALLNLPLPVILAFAAAVLIMLMLGWVIAGLRRPSVVRDPEPYHASALQGD
ncbi:hypothetical protein [Massilia horti]|uniref:hypothetical protein n=1 Tax=Massilia horti TaxID=2562153 RepID=UPI0014316F76|nr:hypothetical protein [Massilia horti]